MLLIANSPLAKIFAPECHDELMRDPELVFKPLAEHPFSLIINTSCSSWIFKGGEARDIQDSHLAWYFSGGNDGQQNQETDWTGIVQMPLESTSIVELLNYARAGKTIPAKLAEETANAETNAQLRSKNRVMNMIKRCYTHLQNQYQKNKEDNKGEYVPSATEFLCGYVLAQELESNHAAKKALTSKFSELMKNIQI